VQTGTFPAQVRIATRCTGWRESAINVWMRNPMFTRLRIVCLRVSKGADYSIGAVS